MAASSLTASDLEPLALADEAYALVSTDVSRSIKLATQVLAATGEPRARSTAHRALGLAAVESGSAEACAEHMRDAIAEARRVEDSTLLAEAEMGLALSHQFLGDRPNALRWSRRAIDRAPMQPRVALQRALLLERVGEVLSAVGAYDRAEALADAAQDPQTLVRVWCNRGVLRIYLGDLPGALSDLAAADAMCAAAGLAALGVAINANLGYLAARRGEMLEALERLDAVTPSMEEAGGLRLGIHELDRCEVLMMAGLPSEAVAAGQAAMTALAAARMTADLAEARVVTAQAALVAGEVDLAFELADGARRSLSRVAGPWVVLADEVAIRASWARGRRDARLAARAARSADALDAAGWRASAASARILSARIELELGRGDRAAAQLRLVDDAPGAPVSQRVQARCATALLRRQAGDRRGARAALRTGWTLLERHRATLGATELRAGATAHVAEVVGLGLEMAIEDRRPREVLKWAERGRVGTLTPRTTKPPEDSELAALLGELRVVAAEADAAAKRGDDGRAVLRRQATLEGRVRSRARLLPAEASELSVDPEPAEILNRLGDGALVEYAVSGGRVWAVVGAAGRFQLRPLGPERVIADEVEAFRVALRRLAFGSPVPQLREAARTAADYARQRLDDLLLAPLSDLIAGRSRVIVPMGVLHAVPWAALGEARLEQVIAPSAGLWLRASRVVTAGGPALLVAGPRLAEADSEVDSIAALIPGATALTGEAATVDTVREAMAGASLAHLACHGRFRADNPLFSSLELHDGALSVFELERLGRAPKRIVLSACDAGLSAVHPGDELLGLAAALLRLGTTGIVASVLPVPDAATRRLMVALHEALAGGAGLAEALATARGSLDPERDDDLVASWAFQVLGAG